MNAIVTAGGIPQPGEPLYEVTQGGPKALLDIAGKPMVQHVYDAAPEPKVIAAATAEGPNVPIPNLANGRFAILREYLPQVPSDFRPFLPPRGTWQCILPNI